MTDRQLPRFSITTLLLITALFACGVSHFLVSRNLAETKKALTSLRNDTLTLDAGDHSRIHVIALPTYGPLQWRWKMQLPTEGSYRLRYGLEQIPETGLPSKSKAVGAALLDRYAKPLPGGVPFILQIALSKDGNNIWQFRSDNGDRGAIIPIKPQPPWLDSKTDTGWGSSISGRGKTTSSTADTPLQLIKMRKSKILPGGGASTVDMNPTDGFALWVERID